MKRGSGIECVQLRRTYRCRHGHGEGAGDGHTETETDTQADRNRKMADREDGRESERSSGATGVKKVNGRKSKRVRGRESERARERGGEGGREINPSGVRSWVCKSMRDAAIALAVLAGAVPPAARRFTLASACFHVSSPASASSCQALTSLTLLSLICRAAVEG